MEKIGKYFAVITVSKNTNSFGLYRIVLLALDGDAYEVDYNQVIPLERGNIVRQISTLNEEGEIVEKYWDKNFENPRQIKQAPKLLAETFWEELGLQIS
jgi:hypothetical protein